MLERCGSVEGRNISFLGNPLRLELVPDLAQELFAHDDVSDHLENSYLRGINVGDFEVQSKLLQGFHQGFDSLIYLPSNSSRQNEQLLDLGARGLYFPN